MSKVREFMITDLIECKEKLTELLKEYRCNISYDSEVEALILVDHDTNKFEIVDQEDY